MISEDHVTLKTGVMMLTIQIFITGINYILTYIKTIKLNILNHNNILQYCCFLSSHKHSLVEINVLYSLYSIQHSTDIYHRNCLEPLLCWMWWTFTMEKSNLSHITFVNVRLALVWRNPARITCSWSFLICKSKVRWIVELNPLALP